MAHNLTKNDENDEFTDPFNDSDLYGKKKNDFNVYTEAMTY